MQLPGVCCHCGRTIDSTFVYCPWCGVSQRAGELVPVGVSGGHAAASCEGKAEAEYDGRLFRISRSLEELERDFSLFALKHQRED